MRRSALAAICCYNVFELSSLTLRCVFQVVDWARGAFFLFGGEPTYSLTAKPTTLGPSYSVIGQDATINQSISEYHWFTSVTPPPRWMRAIPRRKHV